VNQDKESTRTKAPRSTGQQTPKHNKKIDKMKTGKTTRPSNKKTKEKIPPKEPKAHKQAGQKLET
jgi:hypothetical protein